MTTLLLIGLCPGSDTRIPVNDEAVDQAGHGQVLCPTCLTVFTVEPIRHHHHAIALRIPEHHMKEYAA